MKKKNKWIALIVIIGIALGISAAFYFNLCSEKGVVTTISMMDNTIPYKVGYEYRYMHVVFEGGSKEEPIEYKIVDKDGNVIKESKLTGKDDVFIDVESNKYNFVFDVYNTVQIKYTVWTGNLKSKDTLNDK